MRRRLKTGDTIVTAKDVRFAPTNEHYWPQKARRGPISPSTTAAKFSELISKLSSFEQTAKNDYL